MLSSLKTFPLFKAVSPLFSQVNNGFTLTELLVAGALTTTVVGVSGVGLASMLSSSSDSGTQNERRIELNRSLDFIATEVRQAERIEPDANQGLPDAPAFDATDKVPVLTLKIPGVNQRIIYYLAGAEGMWRGPQVIYRWGPNFNSDGSYDDTISPNAWQYEPLIDLISEETSTPDCPMDTTTSPPIRWTANPSTNATGFYSCVSPTGKVASIFHKGQLKKVLDNPEAYALETKVFARTQPPLNIIGGGGTVSGVLSNRRSRVTISNLGGALQCSNGNDVNDGVSGTVLLSSNSASGSSSMSLPDPGGDLVETVEPNTTLAFSVQVRNTTCIRDTTVSSEADQQRQVITLRDGESVPAFETYLEQNGIASFLTAENPRTRQPYLDPDTRKISLAANQLIFLFELGVDFDSSKPLEDQESPFDMQDLVVVATITPDEE
ncbi:hypothetical protein C1752_09160 [Acaryochloris thomasi RCC1774]|uniref:Prepilin-type N-terminal cleavage/methylation domain-containing protein n=1 Tax=Acaryochloris thomasi RCC1774 TaxID=1764569 RepID=A0A2W1J908_9CYAN|nr:hypothetical protein [Acaryochloris thomasi]PZD70760.1 hypothetical protein C1752_09160 [Acaryochloris thomasi RCC1774]